MTLLTQSNTIQTRKALRAHLVVGDMFRVAIMNASFSTSGISIKPSEGTTVPPKEPSEASIGRPFSSSTPSNSDKTKTDVYDDRKSTYRDYSHITKPDTTNTGSVTSWGSTGKEPTFPVKLHKILSSQEFRHVITWLPHGRAWKILDQKAFEDQVIPLFFKHGRYTSFSRQVCGWGFRRIHGIGNDVNAYYHELFLRGMPHLAEKMKRLSPKDEAARKQAQFERSPDFEAISRAKPLPREPPPPPPAAAHSNNMDDFLSSLSDDEARLLAFRRKQMLDRAAQVASSQRHTPVLPARGREMDAYLASLSDEEALVLARRREQELRVLHDKLLRLTQQQQQSVARAPALRANSTTAMGSITLTNEEKLLLATHRAQKLTSGASANTNQLTQERVRWEKMRNALNASSQTVSQVKAALLARQAQSLALNNTSQASALTGALLARQVQGRASMPNNFGRQSIPSVSNMDSSFLSPARQLQTSMSLSNNYIPQQGDLEANIRRAKVQADFLSTATQNDLRRASTGSSSADSDTAILARARQAQVQSEVRPRRDSLSVVKAALDTMRRAEMFSNTTDSGTPLAAPIRETPTGVASNVGEMNDRPSQKSGYNEPERNMEATRESMLRSREGSTEIGVAEFLAMKKGRRWCGDE